MKKKKRESKELVLISMQLVAILLLRHMYGKTLHNNIPPLHAVCKKNARSWKLQWDVTSHFPCISAVCVAQEARTQTHGSHQQTLKVLCTKTLSITVWWCKKMNCLRNRKPQKKNQQPATGIVSVQPEILFDNTEKLSIYHNDNTLNIWRCQEKYRHGCLTVTFNQLMQCLPAHVLLTGFDNSLISQYTHLKPGGHRLQPFYLRVL